nr:hypothetical protein [Tanacetum cinerariifolium]
MANLTFVDIHNMVAYLSKSDASAGFDQIVDFLNAQKVTDVVKLQALIDRKKVVVTEDIIRQDLRLDDADFLINNQVADLSSHTTKYTSPAITQKVFANMRRIGKGFLGVETPLFATMSVQPHVAAEEEDEKDEVPAAPAPPSPTHEPTPPLQEPITSPLHPQSVPQSSPPQEQLTTTSTSYTTLLHTLLKTCITLSYKVATLEHDKVAQALEILKLKRRVKKLEKQRRSKSSGLKRLRKVETQDDLGAELQGRLKEKDKVNDATKEVNVAEPTVFDDEEENINWNLVVEQMQEKHLVTIRKYQSLKRKPISVAQAKKNMIVYLKNMAGYKIAHFKVKALQVKYPLIDWEIYSEGSRSYWKIIRVGGITQAYQSFVDMLKDFDREDLDALWRSVKDKFSTSMPTKDKEKALWVELKRLYKPNAAEKDYPLTDAVLLVMLITKLQVDEIVRWLGLYGGQQTKEQKEFGYIL